jgi:hypothetical protein
VFKIKNNNKIKLKKFAKYLKQAHKGSACLEKKLQKFDLKYLCKHFKEPTVSYL